MRSLMKPSLQKNLNLKILKATKEEEEILRRKFHQLLIKGGDKNTDHFHKQKKNQIELQLHQRFERQHQQNNHWAR